MAISSINDLPLDVLVLVFPYLDASSFLAFCATCKAFQQNSIRLDPAYWSLATRQTFRVPNQPVVEHDGVRWFKLFRRLLTSSRVFTWGSNSNDRLGHDNSNMTPINQPRRLLRSMVQSCGTPTEMANTHELGVIADMQCGGWSTTLLTSKGALYIAGVLDGMHQYLSHYGSGGNGPRALRFPVGFPYSTQLAQYEEPTIAIRQFSSGRAHVLGLSDSGRIWSWYAVDKPALHVKFLNVDITEASSGQSSSPDRPLFGRVKQVVAGWSCSSAYVYGIGIVVWNPVRRDPTEEDETDTMLVMETAEVPKTAYQRAKGASRESETDKVFGEEVGVVLNHIVLEHFIVFVTDIGKVFSAEIREGNRIDDILELRALRNESSTPLDVQGSFRSFAIFKNGEVIMVHQDYLKTCWEQRTTNPEQNNIEGLQRVPALQHNDVISVAFGDYHFLALHSNGKITSYGKENQACGALGLGQTGFAGQLRGVSYGGFHGDAVLDPRANINGRQIWFEPSKHSWAQHLSGYNLGNRVGNRQPRPGMDPFEIAEPQDNEDNGEASARLDLFRTDEDVQFEVSEWIEQESRYWDDLVVKDADDGLGAYFALSVSAAGWHSGAIVLVNEKLDIDSKYNWRTQSFPRLRLKDGREMPGSIDFQSWREGN